MVGAIAVTAAASLEASASELLYLACSGDKSITAYHVDAESGALTQKFRVELPGSPGPMVFSPSGDFIYAAVTGLEDSKAGIVTLSRKSDGTLSTKATSFITSRTPAMAIDPTGRNLIAAHYTGGEVTSYRIVDGVCTSEMLNHIVTEKTAHCVKIDSSGRFVFVPHTTPNKVYQFVLDSQSGKLSPNTPPFAVGPDEDHLYHQPRHIAQHPTLKMAYTSNERGGGITVWKFDPESGTLSKLQTLSTLPADFDGNSAAADINITPNGRFVYVSNRDVTNRGNDSKGADTLAAFEIDLTSGRLTPVGLFAAPRLPRSFCIDLGGKFVYAAGQGSAQLAAYSINQKTGALSPLTAYDTGKVPIWVMCGSVAD